VPNIPTDYIRLFLSSAPITRITDVSVQL